MKLMQHEIIKMALDSLKKTKHVYIHSDHYDMVKPLQETSNVIIHKMDLLPKDEFLICDKEIKL